MVQGADPCEQHQQTPRQHIQKQEPGAGGGQLLICLPACISFQEAVVVAKKSAGDHGGHI